MLNPQPCHRAKRCVYAQSRYGIGNLSIPGWACRPTSDPHTRQSRKTIILDCGALTKMAMAQGAAEQEEPAQHPAHQFPKSLKARTSDRASAKLQDTSVLQSSSPRLLRLQLCCGSRLTLLKRLAVAPLAQKCTIFASSPMPKLSVLLRTVSQNLHLLLAEIYPDRGDFRSTKGLPLPFAVKKAEGIHLLKDSNDANFCFLAGTN